MSLTPGSRIGVYDITAPLGEGGMGQVWRATDSTLGRQVAIKILPDAFAADPERLARFEREAKTLASLNHPHIAAIYGFEKSSGMHALVMELVEGEDLSQRIARGAMPLDEALPIAKQIAEALEAAHEQGIIHRDLKPANIKMRPDGTVKVLDFGLAKAMDQGSGVGDQGSAHLANSPTIASPAMTMHGMILGTAAYMAPEQAKGRLVDRRADIWGFGAVLFEMLTGTRAFRGEDVTDTIVSVVSKEPDWGAVPATTPAGLRRLLTRCLKKDSKARLQAIGDARAQIDELLIDAPEDASGATWATTTDVSRGRFHWIVATAAAVAGMIALAFPAVRHLRETLPPAPLEMRVEITTPATDAPLKFALSPDGRSLVFVASGDGPSRLWLRPLDQAEARPLAGTEGAINPFWSPDSRSLGFFVQNKLMRLDLAGNALQEVTRTVGLNLNASWSADGTILFPQLPSVGPLMRVPAGGGAPVVLTRLDPPRQVGHSHPHFLPDGQHFLFTTTGTADSAGLYLGSLDGSAAARLTVADSGSAFVRPDWVLFVQRGTLMARRLDIGRRVLVGDPVILADRVGVEAYRHGGFSVSDAGQVAYRTGDETRQFRWVNRTGKDLGPASEPDTGDLRFPTLSRDGRRVALDRVVQGNRDIWALDLVRRVMTRLTLDASTDMTPVWSPDGLRLAYASSATGTFDLYAKPSNVSGGEVRLVTSPNTKVALDWSSDGRWLVYHEIHPTTGRDLWALDMTSPNSQPRVVANTPAHESMAQFSPDGRWVAYQTDESGRSEVVVQAFPNAGGRSQVSIMGGLAPRWSVDGKEIYMLGPDSTLMAVPIIAAGTSFEAGTPVALFPTRMVDGGFLASNRPQYAVARDGRFLINQPVGDGVAAPITLILNWSPDGKK